MHNATLARRSPKYHNRRTRGATGMYDSGLERAYVEDVLGPLALAGVIRDLRRQHNVHLVGDIGLKTDADYIEADRERHVHVEVKGFPDKVWLLKKRLWHFFGPTPLLVVTRTRAGTWLTEEVLPKGWREQTADQVRRQECVEAVTMGDLRPAALALAEAPRRSPARVQAVRDAVARLDAAQGEA